MNGRRPHPVPPIEKLGPDYAFTSTSGTVLGFGTSLRYHPGSGPDRYRHAEEFVAGLGAEAVAFVSFTFDVENPDSTVVSPEAVVRVDAGGGAHVSGSVERLPQRLRRAPGSDEDTLSVDNGASSGWHRLIEDAVATIEEGRLRKVVVARTATVTGKRPFSAVETWHQLRATHAMSHIFSVDGLVGASPELLVSCRSGAVESVSLAGSAPGSPDDPMSRDLMASPKDLEEHRYAADSVEDALRPLTSSLDRSTVKVLDFGEIHHLGTSYRGSLLPDVGALQVTAALHPTAAVAGTPRLEALDFIARHERIDRGRYAGPVGWVGGDGSGELAIAIRCGLVGPDSTLLYSGVGVVADSDPDEEWEESMLKMRPMLRALA